MEDVEYAKAIHGIMCRQLVRIAKANDNEETNMMDIPEFKETLGAIDVIEKMYPALKEHGA